jgi:hypothetical protein
MTDGDVARTLDTYTARSFKSPPPRRQTGRDRTSDFRGGPANSEFIRMGVRAYPPVAAYR